MSGKDVFLAPLLRNGRYINPWSSCGRPSVYSFFWETVVKNKKKPIPTKEQIKNCELMKIIPVNKDVLENLSMDKVHCTWLGHAGFLVQLNGYNILFDPILTDSIGPIPWLGKYFTPRYCPSPCSTKDLPPIDVVCISHDHYDHLDVTTVVDLHKTFSSILWCVPVGMGEWFRRTIDSNNINEFTWWEDKTVLEGKQEGNQDKNLTVSFVPAQHWGKRGVQDDSVRLWGGWIVSSSNKKVYHSGDTGYCDIFKSIGRKYCPIDVALLPIGNYLPRPCMKFQHIDPGEAVQIHKDVMAKKSIAMHWGTFALGTTEDHFEPPMLLKKELQDADIPESDFLVSLHGETHSF